MLKVDLRMAGGVLFELSQQVVRNRRHLGAGWRFSHTRQLPRAPVRPPLLATGSRGSSGATIPGAGVRIVNQSTRRATEAVSDEQGSSRRVLFRPVGIGRKVDRRYEPAVASSRSRLLGRAARRLIDDPDASTGDRSPGRICEPVPSNGGRTGALGSCRVCESARFRQAWRRLRTTCREGWFSAPPAIRKSTFTRDACLSMQ